MKSHTRLVAYALTGTLALFPLAACGANVNSQQEVQEELQDDRDDADDQGLAGGWEVSTQATPILTDSQTELFGRAAADYDGVELTPVAVLGTQLVAGTNYAYLCTSEAVVPNALPSWVVAVVYENLEGNAQIISVEDIELADIETLESGDDNDDMVGAWEVVMPAEAAELPQEAASAFSAATQAYEGVDLTPLALLGTQVVSGTNYMVLCAGQTVTGEPQDNLYVAQVYADLDGESDMASVVTFDLVEYID